MNTITRRAALIGAAASSAAAMVPIGATIARAQMAIPAVLSPEERARFHFEAMAQALNEITASGHGWRLSAGEICTTEHSEGRCFFSLAEKRLIREAEPKFPSGYMDVERGEHLLDFSSPTTRPTKAPFAEQGEDA